MTTLLQCDGMPYDRNVELFISLLAFNIFWGGLWDTLQLSCFLTF